MIIIRDDRDLMDKYSILKFWTDEQKEYPKEKYPQIEDVIIKYKKAIREYNKSKQDYFDMEKRIINANKYDSYDVLIQLPDFIDSMKKAKDYFMEYHYREIERTEYDCTGQIFTMYYNIYKRNDGYIVYSHECIDC